MKNSICRMLIPLVLLCLYTYDVQGQDWNWNGRPYHAKVQEYIRGTIQDMEEIKDCTGYNYGKTKYQRIKVHSYSLTPNKIHFEFKFSWRIDWMLGGHDNYSFTVRVSTTTDGCNARVSYIDESGGPDCDCSIGDSFDLGCVYTG